MGAKYDTYDYESYWEGREYEHKAEIEALKNFLSKIRKITKILEIGAGFGRLVPTYAYRAKKLIVSDPSASLLKDARESLKKYKPRFIQAGYDTLESKLRAKTIDLVILIRVLHHIEDPKNCFELVNRLLKDKGYFILEFANKSHFKAKITEFFKGNFTYPLDIFPKNVGNDNNKEGEIAFKNYHPDRIAELLEKTGFEIIEKRSVSNFRSPLLKSAFPINFILTMEKLLQKPLALFNFGPSIFILARKTKHITDL